MPIKKKGYGRRRPAKKQARRPRRRVARRTRNVSDYASLSVTRSMSGSGPGGLFVANTLYSLMDTSLTDFTRAVQVAQGYQHYRIKYISVKFQPMFDSYVFSGAQTQGKPNLYYMIDKSGSVPTNVTLETLKQMGAKPRALDERPIKVGWRPSVLTADMITGGAAFAVQPSQYKISPWLTTSRNVVSPGAWNANSVDHLGLYWIVDSTTFAAAQLSFKVDIEVQFEFKKPLWTGLSSSTAAVPATLAVLDNSPDGIVGGSDTAINS